MPGPTNTSTTLTDPLLTAAAKAASDLDVELADFIGWADEIHRTRTLVCDLVVALESPACPECHLPRRPTGALPLGSALEELVDDYLSMVAMCDANAGGWGAEVFDFDTIARVADCAGRHGARLPAGLGRVVAALAEAAAAGSGQLINEAFEVNGYGPLVGVAVCGCAQAPGGTAARFLRSDPGDFYQDPLEAAPGIEPGYRALQALA
jgi:hypothetical protein